jgi:hypothetical protein
MDMWQPILRYYASIYLDGQDNHKKESYRIASLWAKNHI